MGEMLALASALLFSVTAVIEKTRAEARANSSPKGFPLSTKCSGHLPLVEIFHSCCPGVTENEMKQICSQQE